MCKVSVIIPVYNGEHTINAAIDSVLLQTFRNFEVIVVDDGSTDATRHRVVAYADRVKYIYQENDGRARARNRGIEQASGEYIAFLDSDDRWLPEKLTRQVAAMDAHPQTGFAYTKFFCIGDDGNSLTSPIFPNEFGSGYKGQAWGFQEILAGHFDIRLSTVMVRKACLERVYLERVGYFDKACEIEEDWDLYMRLSHQFPIIFLEDILTAYRASEGEDMIERGRRYRGHETRIHVIESNVARAYLLDDQPATANRLLADAYWHATLIEYGLGSVEQARQWQERAIAFDPKLLERSSAVQRLVNLVHGAFHFQSDGIRQSQTLLRRILNAMHLPREIRTQFKEEAWQRFHMALAFAYYRRDLRGLCIRHAVRALYHQRNGPKDRGLLSITVQSVTGQALFAKLQRWKRQVATFKNLSKHSENTDAPISGS